MKISELKGSFSESVRGSAHFNEQEVLISGGRKAKKTHTHTLAQSHKLEIFYTLDAVLNFTRKTALWSQ